MSDLVSFKWLKDQKMLREGARPRCETHSDIVPDFYEAGARLGGFTRDLPHFSHDGVFVHEMKYYREGRVRTLARVIHFQLNEYCRHPAAEMLTYYG